MGASRTTEYRIGVSGVGILFVSPQGDLIPHIFTLANHCSNNIAEYQSVIMGMEIALATRIKRLEIFGNSKPIVNQINGKYESHIARSLNAKADALAGNAAAMAVLAGSHCEILIKERLPMPDLGT
ncbi:hypothetical protein MRB53_006032 [Persea americana]|uniref:Uncharacterized protein n=1 Tax=Persea americana TaxID=3435 RepID=A0ACC2MF91_PERAE|nr:hypothetical protein MRB53_006032 [Persea americana]